MPDEPRKPVSKTTVAVAAAVLVAAPLTASFEGLRTHPYHDPAPRHTLTVCYGDTEVAMRVYSRDECLMLLEARQKENYAPAVLRCTPGIGPYPQIFASAIDAAYNAGPGNYCRSPAARAFSRGAWAAGCNGYRGWKTLPGTKAHNGLVRRREAERGLCLKGLPPALATHSTPYSDSWPPLRFRGNPGKIVVQVGSQREVDARCGASVLPRITLACTDLDGSHGMMLPDPCLYPATDYYAQIFCHEIGHLNGWPATHGD